MLGAKPERAQQIDHQNHLKNLMKSCRSVLCSAPSSEHLGGKNKNKNNNTTCHTVQNQTVELLLNHEDGSCGGVMILQHKLSTFLDATPPSSSLIQRPRVIAGSVDASGTACSVSTSWLTWWLVPRSSRGKWQPAFPDYCQQPSSLICLILHCQFCVFPDLQSRLTWSDSLRRRGPCSIPRGAHDISATAAAERCTAWENRRHEVLRWQRRRTSRSKDPGVVTSLDVSPERARVDQTVLWQATSGPCRPHMRSRTLMARRRPPDGSAAAG